MDVKLAQRGLDGALAQCSRGLLTRRRLLMQDESNNATDLERALLDAVGLFEELGIAYALVGGLAAMVYGKSRFTEDVDFVAEPGHMETLSSQSDAMKRFGFDPDCVWKLYHQSGIEIDLWKDEHAKAIVEQAVEKPAAGKKIKVARVEDLIAMKLRADRPQDEYDVSEILKARQIDEAVVRSLVTAEQAQRLDEIKQRIGLAD